MNIQKTPRPSEQPKTKYTFGFTLIELIVVITILAILGTIGFLSIGGYSSKARDSARISDVANLSKSLDVSIVTVGSYPTPDNAFAVTYSGGTIWNQGFISTTVLQALRTSISGGGLSKKPVDPLDNSEYEYSSLAFGKAYQIKAEYEGDLNQTAWNVGNGSLSTSSTLTSLLTTLDTSSLTQEASAAPGTPSIAYIKGNYGGLMARTVTGSYTYILAIPSIITSTGSSLTPKIEITNSNSLSGTLLFHGRTLKNASAFNPNLTPVFSGSGKVLTTSTEITSLMTNLKNTYTSSGAPDVKSNTSIASLLTMNTGSLSELGVNLVKNELGISGVSGGPENTDTTVSGTCTSLPSNAVYFNNTTNYSLVSAPSGTSLSAVTAGYSASPVTNTCQFKCGGGFSWNGGSCGETPLYTFTSHTFTNCGATGQNGPSLSACRSSYNSTEVNTWKNTYLNMTQNGYQEWTVPLNGTYRIQTAGASSENSNAGRGAIIQGEFSLTKGDILIMVVGQMGNTTYGGGGGTFVTKGTSFSTSIPLIISGGGGGNYANAHVGQDGTFTETSGTMPGGFTSSSGQGGASGDYSGGGGFLTNGQQSSTYGFGYSFRNGALGGVGSGCGSTYVGGFGGGGGSCPAGGGGYSGGSGSKNSQCGGSHCNGAGGGSYNAGTNKINIGTNTGHGNILITKL